MPGHKPPKRGARPASSDNFDNVPDFSDDATHVSPPHPLHREAAQKAAEKAAAAARPFTMGEAARTGRKPSKPKWLHRVATGKKQTSTDDATAPAAADANADANTATAAAVPVGPALDGQGLRYMTVTQLLKQHGLADTGGAAKHLVRAGGITVNGTAELRPGRKLHHSDVVTVGDRTLQVVILPD